MLQKCVGNDWRVVIAESDGYGLQNIARTGSSEAWGFDEGEFKIHVNFQWSYLK